MLRVHDEMAELERRHPPARWKFISQQRNMNVTPLIEAIWAEEDVLIRSLGTDASAINAPDSDGRTALTGE